MQADDKRLLGYSGTPGYKAGAMRELRAAEALSQMPGADAAGFVLFRQEERGFFRLPLHGVLQETDGEVKN